MGFGSTLILGGNGTLALLGLPSPSPHASVAYAVLALGLRFSCHQRCAVLLCFLR
jgi:hypothetical protein